MIHISLLGERKCSIQQGEAELNGTFTECEYLFHCMNEKTFIICFI